MNPEAWKQISDLFSECTKCSGKDRERLLSGREATEPGVVREVRELLKTYEEDRQFLEHPALDHLTTLEQDHAFARSGPEQTSQPAVQRPENKLFGGRLFAFWLLLAADGIALGFYIFAALLIARYGGLTTTLGWDAVVEGADWRVVAVDASGPASGALKIGDRLRALNGESRMGRTAIISALDSLRPGAPYTILVSRNGVDHQYTLTKQIVNSIRGIGDIAAYLAVSVAFYLTAILIGLMKADQKIAQLAYAALLTEALVLVKAMLLDFEDFLRGPLWIVYQTMSLLDGVHFALAYHFFLRVFERVLKAKVWSLAPYALYLCGGTLAIYRVVVSSRQAVPLFDSHPFIFQIMIALGRLFYIVAPLSICLTIAYSYARVTEPEERRRARWIAFGSLAGILPYGVLRLAGVIFDLTRDPPITGGDTYRLALRFTVIPAILIPISTGYAILKHRLFDIQIIVRRGVQYVLAKSVLQFILALPLLGLGYALIRNADRTLADVILHNEFFVFLLLLITAVLRFRENISRWLDRQFFREKYNEEYILLVLIDSIKELRSLPEIGRRIEQELSAALHPERIYVFYRDRQTRSFTAEYQSDRRAQELTIAASSRLVPLLETTEHAQDLSSIRKTCVSAGDWRWLEALGVDLAVPMNGSDGHLVGFVLLGKKMSEEPYTAADRRLLEALAAQTAIVCENVSLQKRLDEQRRAEQDLCARFEANKIDALRECPDCGRCFDVSALCCPDDGRELIFTLPVKRLVDGRYRLERMIGRGGMGAVYQAWDLRLNRMVAIKILVGTKIADPLALRRFCREARAVARLSHPNIVTTHDFGVIEGEAGYLVMELVPGTTLRAQMTTGNINPLVAAQWFDQLLEGIKAAHQTGIIHRDLKPENVLLSTQQDGTPLIKILDFGIAKTALSNAPDSTNLTIPGTVFGSLNYMSPEQLTAGAVDERSDLFSIGVMVFEVLAGRLPFTARTYTERVVSVLNAPHALQGTSSDTERLNAVLQRCLATDPDRRFASAAELQRELIPLVAQYKAAATAP